MNLQLLQISFIIAKLFCGVLRVQAIQEIVCESHGPKHVHCSGGYINVLEAYYGRTSSTTCGYNGRTDCFARSSPTIIRKNCQGKTSCVLNPSNLIFGDPCYGVVKYIELKYECTLYPTINKVMCDNDPPVRVTCPVGQVIYVNNAYYGRHSIGTCGYSPTTNCESSLSYTIKYQCHLKPACYLHTNFDQPCPNVRKYVEMNYQCFSHLNNVVTSVIVCEGDLLAIGCPPGRHMNIIDAFYGRDDPTSCPGPVHNTNCRSSTSNTLINQWCDTENSCLLQANNKNFGDPCFGTRKFTKVIYKCI